MRRVSISLILLALGAGAAWADPAYTLQQTYMRSAPNFNAPVVQTIPADAEIDVDDCGQLWCTASWQGLSGYVRLSALSFDEGVPAAPPPDAPYYNNPYYDNAEPAPGVVVPFGFDPGGERPRQEWDQGRGRGGGGQGGGWNGGGGGQHNGGGNGAPQQPPKQPQSPPPQNFGGRGGGQSGGQSGGHGGGRPWEQPNGADPGGHR